MSGGFFRGTSADQDTRFSNKQAKLLKSQKFAPEMEHLVDMTKVKMDVMKPWIATRVTELLGFEDEVLINFIYGLLDGKEVNGKQVQISLTGFMEKNTGKFMKELWSLLLSAQNNASGVPQQFLDAKEEETRKKKVEHDRIANEIHKKREKERLELEQEKIKKTDGDIDVSRTSNVPLEPSSKHQLRDANTRSVDEKETTERNGSRSRNRITKSPLSAEQSPPSPRGSPPGPVKSFSNSKSDSRGKNRSRSVSSSPKSRGRSISAERSYRSPRRRSITPRRRHSPRRYFSPPRYRSSHSRRRSISRSRRRSPSPLRRRRSPPRDISLSPVERRSRSPRPYGSRRRSPSPVRRRSPSPLRRRYRRSSSTPPRRYPSPTRHRSPVSSRRRSPSPPRRRSPSPQDWSSPSPVRRTSPAPSPVRRRSPKRQRRSLERSPRGRIRSRENYSPVRRAPPPGENVEKTLENRRRSESPVRRPRVSLRSPQRDLRVPSASPSPSKLSSASESPRAARKRSYKEDRRSSSAHESPVKQTREERTRGGNPSPVRKQRDKHRHDSPDTGVDKEEIDYSRSSRKSLHSPKADERKGLPEKGRHKDEYLHGRVATHRSGDTHNRHGGVELAKKDQETKSRRISDQEELPKTLEDTLPSEKHRNDSLPSERDEKTNALKASKKIENDDQIDSDDSDIQENNKTKHKDKRKHKREATSDDESYDSEIEDRKEAKKRRKEEKRSRKEERRRRREERRRKRKERHADKIKTKSVDMGSPPSDLDVEEAVSEQKRLEIELREKALESLRAKKGVTL